MTVTSPVALASLTVRDFRNLTSLDLEFPAEGVVVIGENGQGKTSLLEAVYYPVLFRSLRGARDRDLVRFGEAGFFVAVSGETRVQAGYEITSGRKKVSLDGVPVPRFSDAFGRIVAIPFSPSDREMVSGGPSQRRRFLDVLLSLDDPQYLNDLTAYRAALKQRNAALRNGKPNEASLFDASVASRAAAITACRVQWVEHWKARYGELCEALGETGVSTVEYSPRHAVGESADQIREELERQRARDLSNGSTSVGPHRHDLRLLHDSKELRHFGSAGQQRTASIALRMLEVEALRERTGRTPVTLYDDVFAELDEGRQTKLLELIRQHWPGQSILVAPRDDEVPAEILDRTRWTITGGRIGR